MEQPETATRSDGSGPDEDIRRDRIRNLLLGSAVEAFREIASEMDSATAERLERAIADRTRQSAFEVVLRFLEEPAALGTIEGDPLARARMRGVRARQQLLEAEGGPVSAAELGKEIGVSRQTVDAWRKARRVLAIERGRRGFAYPAWQALDGRLLPGLDLALEALSGTDFWGALNFFLTPDPRIEGKRPLDVLREGDVRDVERLASSHGEHGAL
jgi:DNA-binding XRE family transcriptional regulator